MRRWKEKVYLLAKKYSSKVGLDLPYFIKGRILVIPWPIF